MPGADQRVSTQATYREPSGGEWEDKAPGGAGRSGLGDTSPQVFPAGSAVYVSPPLLSWRLLRSPDRVFFDNGPGDPTAATHEVELLRCAKCGTPYFSICSNQLLGRAGVRYLQTVVTAG